MADHESLSHYKLARQMGRKYLSDNSNKDTKGYLLILDDIIKDADIVSELNLRTREIPLNKVIGTRTSARSNAFAGNFMPLLSETTEFAIKWMNLYNSHIEEGIREPVKVYEYINRYFVLEGNKRVSVLKYLDAVSLYAKVTRLIPRRDETNRMVSIYYEFLDFDKRVAFDNLWFSRQGAFTHLVEIVEQYKLSHSEMTKSTAELINDNFKTFRLCYNQANFKDIPITSGDAFLEYTEIYGFHDNLPTAEVRDRIKKCEEQFKLMASQDTNRVTTIEMLPDEGKSYLSFFSKKPQKLKVAFAFESSPDISLWTYTHYVAMKRLERAMGNKIEVIAKYNVPHGVGAYPAMQELIEQDPNIVFATSPNMSNAALRLSLENPERAILNCDRAQPMKNMMTYFPKVHDASYLCGILAGAMTRSDVLGYITPARIHRELTYGVNAFAAGARMVNPNAVVVNYIMPKADTGETEHIKARTQLAKRKVDMAFCQHQLNTPLVRKGFPGVYAQLYLLSPNNGNPQECIGAAAYDWSVFYNQIVSDCFTTKHSILDISRSGLDSTVHFGWGIETGMLDVYGVDAFMGHNAAKLMKIFRNLILNGMVHPFEGPLFDRDLKVRVEKDDVPTLLEIQNMNWFLDSIVEVIKG